jgi:hypothetical protein
MQATGDGSRRLKTGLFERRAVGLRLSDERVRQSGSKDAHRNAMVGGHGRANARAWTQIAVLSDMAHTTLRKEGIVNSDGEPRRLLADFRQL